MPGKYPRLNRLAAQKQLLLAESELNRAQLAQEWRALADDAHALADQTKTIRSLATATATLVAGLTSFRHKPSSPSAEKPSWWQTLLKGAGVVGTFWQTFRVPPTEPNDP